jgi:hypothetical protein
LYPPDIIKASDEQPIEVAFRKPVIDADVPRATALFKKLIPEVATHVKSSSGK